METLMIFAFAVVVAIVIVLSVFPAKETVRPRGHVEDPELYSIIGDLDYYRVIRDKDGTVTVEFSRQPHRPRQRRSFGYEESGLSRYSEVSLDEMFPSGAAR